MADTQIDIKKIAKLANLNLSDDQIKKLTPQIEEVIGYIEKLNSAKTEHLEGTARATDIENVVSDDKPQESLTQKEALSGAKDTKDGQFKVGAILDNE